MSFDDISLLEKYSEDLVFAANVCHQLHINIQQLERQFNYIVETDHDQKNAVIDDQLVFLKKLLADAGTRFKRLLAEETQLTGLTYLDHYPFVQSYPKWISDLFPYVRDQGEDNEILLNGGSNVYFFDSDTDQVPDVCIYSDVPDSFISVWFPIAAGFSSPGFIWKDNESSWKAYGLEC